MHHYSEYITPTSFCKQVDVQTEHNKVTLHDTTASPQAVLRTGGRIEISVHMDVRELGAHTLTCSSFYTDPEGHRHFLPQLFRFSVSNPLSVRTNHRAISSDTALLEVTLENKTRAPLFLSAVDFLAEAPFSAQATVDSPEQGHAGGDIGTTPERYRVAGPHKQRLRNAPTPSIREHASWIHTLFFYFFSQVIC